MLTDGRIFALRAPTWQSKLRDTRKLRVGRGKGRILRHVSRTRTYVVIAAIVVSALRAHKCIPPESSLVHRWTQTLARRLGCAQAAMPTSRAKDMRAMKKLALKGAKPPRM